MCDDTVIDDGLIGYKNPMSGFSAKVREKLRCMGMAVKSIKVK